MEYLVFQSQCNSRLATWRHFERLVCIICLLLFFYSCFIVSLFRWEWFAPFALFSLLFLMFIPANQKRGSSSDLLWSLLLISILIIFGYQTLVQRSLVFFFALCIRLLVIFLKSTSWKGVFYVFFCFIIV